MMLSRTTYISTTDINHISAVLITLYLNRCNDTLFLRQIIEILINDALLDLVEKTIFLTESTDFKHIS